MFGSYGGNAKIKEQKKIKLMQQNLNHCEAAQDLLMKTVTEAKPDLLLISEPYRKRENPQWIFDATGKAAIWSCNNLSFQDIIDSTQLGYVRTKLENIYFFRCYAPPSG